MCHANGVPRITPAGCPAVEADSATRAMKALFEGDDRTSGRCGGELRPERGRWACMALLTCSHGAPHVPVTCTPNAC